eukprot:TRINITY_DN4514_c0_g1_i1.p1 TRINITY_DN4514_c0_g1~~TRINITY_DN4514_c0_g1_i1.p1  ORF type:complete len:1126 (-),score=268.47 TRINITY_DN4514_c0_g1_i1:44-3421(-)
MLHRRRSTSIASESAAAALASIDPRFLEFTKQALKSESTEQMKYFLLAYRRYATPSELYAIWVHRFKQLCNGYNSKTTRVLYQRLMEFMFIWASRYSVVDFSKKEYSEIIELTKDMEFSDKNKLKLLLLKGNELRKVHSLADRTKPSKLDASFESPTASEELFRQELSNFATSAPLSRSDCSETSAQEVDFTTFPSVDIAKSLTKEDFKLFVKVFAIEFLSKIGWRHRSDKDLPSPHIIKLINRFNQVSFWVTTEILTRTGKDQLKALQKFINIAKECNKLNNFNGMMSIISGLNNSSVQRLKRLWSSLPDTFSKEFGEMEDLMSIQSGFKNYQNEINNRTQPIMPYFALFLRDFTFISEANLPYTPDNHINADAVNLLGERAEHIHKYQSVPYKLDTLPEIDTFLKNFRYIDDEEVLFQMSLKAEPSMWVKLLTGNSGRRDSHEDSVSNVPSDDDDPLTENPESDESIGAPAYRSSESGESKGRQDRQSETEVKRRDSPVSTPIGRPRSNSRRSKNVRYHSIKVPRVVSQAFYEVERILDREFSQCCKQEEKGTIEIFGERYLLIRGNSLAKDFTGRMKENMLTDPLVPKISTPGAQYDFVEAKSAEFSGKVTFDIGYCIGKNDSEFFRNRMAGKSQMEIMAAGCIYLTYSGWASMEIRSNSSFDPNEFFMHFKLSQSFEASSWLGNAAHHRKGSSEAERFYSTPFVSYCVCKLIGGYMSGFATGVFGRTLVAVEATCKAKADGHCCFILASPDKIDELILDFIDTQELPKDKSAQIKVPLFLDTRKDPHFGIDAVTKLEGIAGASLSRTSSLNLLKAFRTSSSEKVDKPASPKGEVVSVDNIMHRARRENIDVEAKANRELARLFEELSCNPKTANVSFNSRKNERYIFVRAKSLSTEMLELMQGIENPDTQEKSDLASKYSSRHIYSFSKMLGRSDEHNILSESSLKTPSERTYGLVKAAAFTGWGKLELSAGSKFQDTETGPLVKFSLRNSVETETAAAKTAAQELPPKVVIKAKRPICILTAGYLAGWVSSSLGKSLLALEVSCMALGHHRCTFFVGTPESVESALKNHLQENSRTDELPIFMSRIQLLCGGVVATAKGDASPSKGNIPRSSSRLGFNKK